MNINLSKLSDELKTSVLSGTRLRPDFGLKMRLRDSFALNRMLTLSTADGSLYHTALYNLTRAFGLVVIEGSVVDQKPNVTLNTNNTALHGLAQDFFHKDGLDGVTVLTKKRGVLRRAPTLYACLDDVSNALRKLDPSLIPTEAYAAFAVIKSGHYAFSLKEDDILQRHAILEKCPLLTGQVAALISPDKMYAQSWLSEEPVTVLHCDSLLHGRPASADRYNPVQGMLLKP